MAAKTSPEKRAEILRLHRDGWTFAAMERKFAITSTTIQMICDPDYAERRRLQINENRRLRPPPSELKRRKRAEPTMPQIGGK